VRALIRLQDVNDAFLFVGRYVNPEMVRLTDADDRYRAVDALKENWNYIYYTATALYLVAVMLQVWAFFRLRDYKV
jgi:nitrogen fixation/metabolism regulation signal transduction histidine kinase